MKKEILITFFFSLLLLMLSSFSFSGGPFNIASGNYVLIGGNEKASAVPFYDRAGEGQVFELLSISGEGIWTMLVRCIPEGPDAAKKLLVGRYLIEDDRVIFVDDTHCCTFTGKIRGDRLVVKPEITNDNFLFVRMNNSK